MNKYDVVVVGGGSGGLTAAAGFSKFGKKVLLIEKGKTGGECTHSGCVPSKAFLHLAKEYYNACKVSDDISSLVKFKENILQKVRSKVEEIYNEETPDSLEKKGIKVVIGEAEFVDKNTISVGGEKFSFKKAVVATGSSPRVFNISGLQEKFLLTNQNIFSLEKIPEKMLVLGSGPIGLELGQAFAMLGTRVTIVTNEDKLLSKSEAGISKIVNKVFTELGVEVLPDSKIVEVKGNLATILLNKENITVEKEFDYVLQAVGRFPNIPNGLQTAGVAYDQNGILVNKHFRTSNKNIFAVGDVCLQDKFTHTADNAARHVVAYVVSFGLWVGKTKKQVPKIIYTQPEIASVGMSPSQIKEKYKNNFLCIEVPYKQNDRAKTDQQAETGLVVVYVRKYTGKILGANIVGQNAGELLHIFLVAMENNISMWKLHSTIFAYPTYSQLIKKSADIFLSKIFKPYN